ncbi:hypothetical protein AB4Z17_16040 [Paenibacillus sp. TAF43_2]|uniref:AAA family ATPase n=1 Tax=Paenibacillus sp. TAF43_2 TaxID=3233069 RepID=UPI003F95526B
MRINAITIEAFRGFNEKRRFEFPNTSIVILHGPNGYGKTSFFDAIEWGLTGSIYRYEQDPERKLYRYIGNHFAGDRAPKVIIELGNSDLQITVTRTGIANTNVRTDSGAHLLEVEINGEKVPAKEAEVVLKEKLVHAEWLDKVDLNKSLFLTHLLCQERMNGILRGMKEKDRYNSVSRIFGTEQFASYGELVHKARVELEERKLAFSQKRGQLIAEEDTLEHRIQGIKLEISEFSPASRNNQWSTALHNYEAVFQKTAVSEDEDLVILLIKEAEEQIEALVQERNLLENDTIRRLDLAKDAMTSLQEKLPLLMQWERESRLTQTLDEHLNTIQKLLRLNEEADSFLQNELIKLQNEQLNEDLQQQTTAIQHRADHLFEALNDVKKLLLQANNRKKFDGMSGGFAMAYPRLEESPRLALYHSLRELELRFREQTDMENAFLEADRLHKQQLEFVQQLVLHEKKHKAFLKHVLQVAIEQPELECCPACGIEDVDSLRLQNYVSAQMDAIHPDLARAEKKSLELELQRQIYNDQLFEAKANVKESLTILQATMQEWSDQHIQLLDQVADLQAKHYDLHKKMQLMDKSYNDFKALADELDIPFHTPALKELLLTKLDESNKQVDHLRKQLITIATSFSSLPRESKERELKHLQDDVVVSLGKLTAEGIVGASAQTTNWSAVADQLEAKASLIEESLLENTRKHGAATQLLDAFRANADLALLEQLQQQKTAKHKVIERVEEGLRTIEDLVAALKDAEQAVPDAIRGLNERVMDQMFDTMRSIFVRINSHPVFTEIDYDTGKKFNSNRLFLKVMTREDTALGHQEANPSYIFSAAQVNATAISFFLAMALTQSWSPLSFVAMDDPVQSMDDLNVAALIDLIRNLADSKLQNHKQFIISTHDSTFYQVMRKKFRMLNVGIIEYDSYSEAGPTFEQRVVEATDKKPIAIFSKADS